MDGQQQQLHLALCVLAVLSLLIIAYSQVQQIPASTSGFQDTYKSSLPFLGERTDTGSSSFVGSGGQEQPVFWNMGNMGDINKYLQASAQQPEAPAPADGSSGFTGFHAAQTKLGYPAIGEGFSGKTVGAKIGKIAQAEKFVGTGM